MIEESVVDIEEVSRPSRIQVGSALASKMLLRRKGSDTAELMRNEQVLACSDSDHKIGGITNLASESATFTSLGSASSAEEIPYMDNTSSSDGEN